MRLLPRSFLFVVFCAGLAGCTAPLTQSTTNDLDRLGKTAASLIGTPAVLQRAARVEARDNTRMCRYLSGQSYDLGAAKPAVKISALARDQSMAGAALKAYIEALVKAANGGNAKALETARQDFSAASGALFAKAGVAGDPAAATNALTRAVLRAGESRRQARIRAVMDAAIDDLVTLEALLERDATQVTAESRSAVAEWDRAARCILRVGRTREDAPATYRALDQRRAEFARQLDAITQAPEVVDALIEAHLEVTDEDAEFEEGIAAMIDILKDTRAVARALTAEGA